MSWYASLLLLPYPNLNLTPNASLLTLTPHPQPLPPAPNTNPQPLTRSKPGAKDPAIGFDGKEYWGMEQLNTPIAEYSVSYSLNGGDKSGPPTQP